MATRYFGSQASGDLNGDGMAGVAFLLTQERTGRQAGPFFSAVVALRTGDGYVGTIAVLLGGRVAPQPATVRDGIAIVNYAERRAGEPFTTRPSMGVSEYLRVVDGKLVER